MTLKDLKAWLLVVAVIAVSCKGSTSRTIAKDSLTPVTVDVYLMASCPFAAHALRGLLPSLRDFGPLTDLRLHHIGGVLESGELDSLYGESDLTLGRWQLCAEQLGGDAALSRLLECQLRDGEDAMASCDPGPGVDTPRLRACVEGAEGDRLLRKSFARAARAEQRASPEIFIAGERYDGGHSPQHFLRALCESGGFEDLERCSRRAEPLHVDVTLVQPATCTKESCDSSVFERFVHQKFLNGQFEAVSAQSARGQALIRVVGTMAKPPFALIGPTAREDPYGFAAVRKSLRALDGDPRFLLALGDPAPRVDDPTQVAPNAPSSREQEVRTP